MKILSTTFRNFGSYGNKNIIFSFPDQPALNLILGINGQGKCLLPSTEIEPVFESKKDLEKFKAFLEIYRSKK